MKRALLALAALLAFTGPARASAIDVAVLDSLQYRGFLYFWNEANPANGLVKDRSTAGVTVDRVLDAVRGNLPHPSTAAAQR